MSFELFNKHLQTNFTKITSNVTGIFEVQLDKDQLWNLYLDSFPVGTNEIYIKCREHDCSACRHFIKAFGNVVVIQNNEVKSIWDFEINDTVYDTVAKALSKFVKSHPITDFFFSPINQIGVEKNFKEEENGKITNFKHLHIVLDDKFVHSSKTVSIAKKKGQFRDTKNVFKRSLDEISKDSIETVLELISQNSLYKGEEWKSVLTEFLKYKKEYEKLPDNTKDIYCWNKAFSIGGVIGRIKNHSIGTLLIDISNNEDIDIAVKKYEAIVAPSNYKRPKAIFTQKMIEDAKKTIEELGYLDSLNRRYANLNDISINNILFANRNVIKKINGNVFDDLNSSISINSKKFSKVEEISIENFISNVLPTSPELELLFENRHTSNLVSLITSVNDSPSMFKWSNPFSWAYNGNVTDSIKENVKAAGGSVTGVLRFSIQWNDKDVHDTNDLDAHCVEPSKFHIYYGQKRSPYTNGQLDVDIMRPISNIPAVENITWPDIYKMKKGEYLFYVDVYNYRGGDSGFKAQIEFNNEIYNYEYNESLRSRQTIEIATVTLDNNNQFSINEKLKSNIHLNSKEEWNIKTNQFIPVNVISYSPNYWDNQNGIGNKHYFFMLNNCINPTNPNGFYNEYLKEDLMKHKRVFEAIGGKTAVQDTPEQLSGLGFSSTIRNSVFMKIKGKTERIVKIVF